MIIIIIIRRRRRIEPATSAGHWVKLKESAKRNNNIDLARKQEKAAELESKDDTSEDWCVTHCHKMIDTRIGVFGNKSTSGDFQTIALLRLDRILRRELETFGDLLSLELL